MEKEANIKKTVRERYAKIAKQNNSCCATVSSCCGTRDIAQEVSKRIGYTEEDLKTVPEGANLGLGCGNPIALASLKEGEIVLDLGSGAGIDCFLAAQKVGKKGKVIGVDMTPEMIEKARKNARKNNYKNVEFRLGEIENLPVTDNSVDVIISNCVINLSQDKRSVFDETFRVLKPGGRLMISDLVLLKELPEFMKNSTEAYISCLSGAIMKDEYINTIRNAGFKDVRIIDEVPFPVEFIFDDTKKAQIDNLKIPLKKIDLEVVSVKVSAIKPDNKY